MCSVGRYLLKVYVRTVVSFYQQTHNFLLRVNFLNSTISYVVAGDNDYSTKTRQTGHANVQPIYYLLSMLEAYQCTPAVYPLIGLIVIESFARKFSLTPIKTTVYSSMHCIFSLSWRF